MTAAPDETAYRSIPEQYGRLVSYSLPCPGVSLVGFLRQALGEPRFYWESSRDHVAFAGFGAALELMAWGADRFETIRRRAAELFSDAVVLDDREPLAGPRLFGGFAFRDDFVPDVAWADFTPAHFVLPHYQLVSVGGEKWLTINVHIPPDDAPRAVLPELEAALRARIAALREGEAAPAQLATQQPTAISYPMPYEAWAQKIADAQAQMVAGTLNKVVLSRVCEVRFPARVQVDGALKYLTGHYAECYRFLFEPQPYRAFYGATPELLAEVSGQSVRTMALAGSIRRGTTPEEDAGYARQLLNDPKERYEHAVVVEKLRERLGRMVDALHVAETGIYRLSNIQHLYTPITGRLQENSGVLPVVAALHPTPALGGDPRERAMQIIRESEPVPRGWYAAPVGWLDRHMDGQFAVAIRSAVAQERRVWLYAGAGIVAESVPEKEWAETALKFRPMLDALGIREQSHVEP